MLGDRQAEVGGCSVQEGFLLLLIPNLPSEELSRAVVAALTYLDSPVHHSGLLNTPELDKSDQTRYKDIRLSTSDLNPPLSSTA